VTDENELIARARGGDRAALGELLAANRHLVYNLALRMLGNPADAEDASQEILIRLMTALDTFRGESSFRTWVYRVAANQLLTTRKRQAEERTESFDELADYLEAGLAAGLPPLEDTVLVNEAKLICTSRMLLCLDRDHRLAFILGEILELPTDEGAAVLEIGADAFRKRLSRARARMSEFTQATCGLVDPQRPCRCARQAACALDRGYLDPKRPIWTVLPLQQKSKQAHVDEVDGLERAVAVLRVHPSYAAPASLVDGIKKLIGGGESGLLNG
jgi:RNA polymerase sigma factor (sigma-70 family)